MADQAILNNGLLAALYDIPRNYNNYFAELSQKKTPTVPEVPDYTGKTVSDSIKAEIGVGKLPKDPKLAGTQYNAAMRSAKIATALHIICQSPQEFYVGGIRE